MKELLVINKVFFLVIGGFIGLIFGEVDGFFFVLMVFIFIDYIIGFMVVVVEKKLVSNIGFKGIFKKIVFLFLVVVG